LIVTDRLEIIPATIVLTRAALHDEHALETGVGAFVPATWPPEYLDPPSLEFTLDRLAEGPEQAGGGSISMMAWSRALFGSGSLAPCTRKVPPNANQRTKVSFRCNDVRADCG
jgi:hypothetical protein